MQFRSLGRTGAQVSDLCLGAMTFRWKTDEEEAFRVVDRFMEAGGNFVDTANVYGRGKSEEITGRALNRDGKRDRIFLATKAHGKMSDDEIEDGGARVKVALKQAYPADSYQAALADIDKSWTDGDISLIKKHLRSNDINISVFLTSAYKYSLNSSDFAQITRDAFDTLTTVSFNLTDLQKATNGDITAYGKHVYRSSAGSDAAPGELTPFDVDADSAPGDDGSADRSLAPDEKTVYVS